MKVNTSRLDMTNPFAKQRQMSATVMNALQRHPTLTHAQLMEQLVAPENTNTRTRMHATEISSVMTTAPANQDFAHEMPTIQQPVQLLFRRRRVMRPVKWHSRMALVRSGIGKFVTKKWCACKKQMKRQVRQRMRQLTSR